MEARLCGAEGVGPPEGLPQSSAALGAWEQDPRVGSVVCCLMRASLEVPGALGPRAVGVLPGDQVAKGFGVCIPPCVHTG